MDDLKLYAKNEEQKDTLVRAVYVFSSDIGVEFDKKYGILSIKRGKIAKIKWTELPDG